MAQYPVSVLLIREYAEQTTGNGCCGTMRSRGTLDARHFFDVSLPEREQVARLDHVLDKLFPPRDGRPQVCVTIVDPRNQLYLIPKLWRDVWRYRPGWRAALATLLQCFSLPAVIVGGRVISRRGRPIDPDRLCHAVCAAQAIAPGDDPPAASDAVSAGQNLPD